MGYLTWAMIVKPSKDDLLKWASVHCIIVEGSLLHPKPECPELGGIFVEVL